MTIFVGARPREVAARQPQSVPATRGDLFEDLSEYRKAELVEMALGLGLEARGSMTKARLIEMIEEAR